ncbi:MAG: hypothetical protein C5B47_08070 [Verrucomicrobia bacterium]|nr:MAG: hypothetical protein C5B47_08070 [Verrucomicrobiota bacterium]
MRIRARNFLPYANLDLQLPDGVTRIKGFNFDDNSEEGCGKSAIPNLICWTLFGEIPKDALIDDVVKEGERGCETELYFPDFSIFRSRAPNDLCIKFADGKIHRGRSATETQKDIVKLLGMNFASFCQSVYFAQNYAKKFVTANQEEKGKIFSDMLDLEQFDRARKIASERIKEMSAQLMSISSNLKIIEDRVRPDREAVQTFEGLIAEFQEQKTTKIRRLLGEIERVEEQARAFAKRFEAQKREKLEAAKAAIAQVAKETADHKAFLERFEPEAARKQISANDQVVAQLKRDLEELVRDREAIAVHLGVVKEQENYARSLEESIERHTQRLAMLETKADRIKERLETLDGRKSEAREALNAVKAQIANPKKSDCPTCGQPWDGNTKHLEKELRAKKTDLSRIEDDLAGIREDQKSLTEEHIKTENSLKQAQADRKALKIEDTTELRALQKGLADKIHKTQEVIGSIEAETEEFKADFQKLKIAQTVVAESEKRSADLRKQLKEAEAMSPDSELARFQSSIDSLGEKIVELDVEQPTQLEEKLAKAREQLKTTEEQVVEYEIKKTVLTQKVAMLEVLKDGYREVKAYTFERTLALLTAATNKYLESFFSQKVKIQFKNEDLKITTTVKIDGKPRSLGLFSGGQFCRVDLAVFLALSDIMLSRKGKLINLLIMDEAFKGLSPTSMKRVLKVLQARKTPTLLIEHNEIFGSAIDQTINVEYRDGTARVI